MSYKEGLLQTVHTLEIQREALGKALPLIREAADLYDGDELQTHVRQIMIENGLAFQ